jgi:hypothetical protein
MAEKWKSMPELVPADAAVVWVRRAYWSVPTLATWDETAQTMTFAGGLVLPWHAMMKWKAQT